MGFVIGDVATLNLEMHRHSAVTGHSQDVEELLEIGPVILVVPPGDRQGLLPGPGFLLGVIGIGAVEGDGGRVVVQFVQFNLELGNRLGRDDQDQRGDIALKQPIQARPRRSSFKPSNWSADNPRRSGAYTSTV